MMVVFVEAAAQEAPELSFFLLYVSVFFSVSYRGTMEEKIFNSSHMLIFVNHIYRQLYENICEVQNERDIQVRTAFVVSNADRNG
jgi:hypothetical protein